MTSPPGTGSCASLLRDVSRRLTHEANNAANGVAVNLEVVRSRTAASGGAGAAGPFAQRASEQLEILTAAQEVFRALLQLLTESLDESRVRCRLSPGEDAFEIIFAGAVIPRDLRAGSAESPISVRNSSDGVILCVPRIPSSSE